MQSIANEFNLSETVFLARVFEQSSQIVTLLFVLVLGISAGWIHRFVDERLSKIFFRTRLRAIAEIERVARETDAATDAQAVLNVAGSTVVRAFQPLFVAIYERGGRGYERSMGLGEPAFQNDYDYNDAQPLRLRLPGAVPARRRWVRSGARAFRAHDATRRAAGIFLLRPKNGSRALLSDEVASLSLLAHHAGLAFAWLGRAPVPPLRFGTTLQRD